LLISVFGFFDVFFFKKGISLTTSDKGANFLQKKARKMKDTIKNGTMPMLIMSSVVLAFFASMIELPCTAGFPIVYTSILSGMEIASGSLSYYFWIVLYNLFYVIPLAVIITVFGYTFRGKAISEKTVQKIKFIGGFIMILLGIILLVNPGMIGIGM
jgi:cytochrome c biogenesis protein CcdA